MDAFYTVIHEQNGRLQPCGHQHPTLAEAYECYDKLPSPEAITGWVKDRTPQWSRHERHPGNETNSSK